MKQFRFPRRQLLLAAVTISLDRYAPPQTTIDISMKPTAFRTTTKLSLPPSGKFKKISIGKFVTKSIINTLFSTANFCSIAALSLTSALWSDGAHAEIKYSWHWETTGGGSSCGPFCTGVTAGSVLVYDGYSSESTDNTNGERFPNRGRGGGAGKDRGRLVDYPGTPGKGCSLTPNIKGVRGLLPGMKRWVYYIDPAVPSFMQSALRDNYDAINRDQKARGSDFQFVEVNDHNHAESIFTIPRKGISKVGAGGVVSTKVYFDRDGYITDTYTVVPNAPLTADMWNTIAPHEIGHTTGLDDSTGDLTRDPDNKHPTVMSHGNEGQKMEPCTLAGIDANTNQGKN